MWRQNGDIIYRLDNNFRGGDKVLSLDMQGTLVISDKGDYVARTATDWIWVSSSVPSTLQHFYNAGYSLVVFSNHRTTQDLNVVQEKTEYVQRQLGIPVDYFYSTTTTSAKPSTTMWVLYTQLRNVNMVVEHVHVGDAIGVTASLPPYQQADTDLVFARNVGALALAPNEFFLQEPVPSFPSGQEVIITVGQQGSGKEEFSYNYLPITYRVVHRKKNYTREIITYLDQGYSVYFQATNPTRSNRQEVISLATQRGVPYRIFWFARPGHEYNKVRGDPTPEAALSVYTKRFEPIDDPNVVRVT